MKTYKVVVLVLAVAGFALAGADYTGYSGAPGSQGTCAGSCHGSGGGTIQVTGFPTNYAPGQAYSITVSASGLANFNASVRVGSGSQIAGNLAAGTNTAIYSVSGETQGVHLSSPNTDNGTFSWTAPNPGVGDVKLYFAGHQNGMSGPNTEIVLTATGSAVAEPGRGASAAPAFGLEQTVVRTHLVVRVSNPGSATRIRLIDRTGRVVGRLNVKAGANQAVAVPLLDRDQKPLAAGAYLATFASGRTLRTFKFTVVSR